jgi:hypothetical protein
LTAGLEERLKGSSEGLNIYIEKAGLNLRALVPDGFHEAEGVSTTDLGTP